MNSLNPNYNLPPIRKIGPAVLPKPKNIKIQAGRVIRLEQPDVNNFQKLNFDNNNYISNNTLINQGSDFVLQQPTSSALDNDPIGLITGDKFAKINNVKSQHDNQKLNKTGGPPHRAKLVQIPDTASNDNQPSSQSTIIDSAANPINTSQYKFPRKSPNNNNNNVTTSSTTTVPLSSYMNRTSPNKSFMNEYQSNSNPSTPLVQRKSNNTNSNSSFIQNDIPIQITNQQKQQQPILQPSFKTPSSFIRPKSDDSLKQASIIDFSADGANNRPTITITTNKNPTNNGASSMSNLSHFQIHPQQQQQPKENKQGEGFTYNIPIQYVQKSPPAPMSPAQQQRHNFVVPIEQSNKSKSSNGNFQGYNNSNSTSYTIPVNLSYSNAKKNESNNNSPVKNLDDTGEDDNNNNSNSSLNNYLQQQISGKQQQRSNFINSFANNNNNNNNGLKITEKPKSQSIDEVDLLKDLLMKNLNASSDPNFFGMCMKCNDKIYGADNGLRAMDQLFHVSCFNCQGCNVSLQGQHFYAMEKKSFCEGCYMKLLEKCTLCSRAITDRILRATGKPFHPECFNCTVCVKNLDGIPFTVDASNKIHCIDCFHDKYAPRCFICNLSIVPEPGNEETIRIVAMEKSFHVHCYKCEDCGVSLASNAENTGGCFPLDEHILCKGCNIDRIRNMASQHDQHTDMYANQKLLRNQMHHLTSNIYNNNGNGNNVNSYNARSTDL